MTNLSGCGIGLRMPHYQAIMRHADQVGWVELLLDNWLYDSAAIRNRLLPLVERFPITLHGVGLSLGSAREPDIDYLVKVRELIALTDAQWYSEHLSLSWVGNEFIPDLLPLCYCEATLDFLADRIDRVQTFLCRPLLLENVSSYLAHAADTLAESQFISELIKRTGAYLLLDVNNLYVNQQNLQRDALLAIDNLPLERVRQIHLGGFEDRGDFLLDAHNSPVSDAVWSLYRQVLQLTGPIPTLIEWDNDLPVLDVLLAQKHQAQRFLSAAGCQSESGCLC